MDRSPLDAEAVRGALGGLGVGRVEVRDTAGSTSDELRAAVLADPEAWPDRSLLVADHQEAGRGRAGRTWLTPRGVAVTVSILLRPRVPADRLGWVGLLGGLACAQALRDLGGPAVLKWPNDVLLPGPVPVTGWGAFRKVAGVLADVVPGAGPGQAAVVLGIGVNVAQEAAELPVPHATSLALAGLPTSRPAVLGALVARLVAADVAWRAAGGDAVAAGLAGAWTALAVTPGRRVAVDLPGGAVLEGVAQGLAADGALLVVHDGGVVAVHAGDVRLRLP